MFPGIRSALKEWWQERDAPPLSLGLEEKYAPIGANWYLRNGYPGLYAMHGGGSLTWSGESVSENTALSHSVVWACKRLISESTAFMPLHMMQERGGEKQPAKKHPAYSVLHDAPNEETTSMSFRETETGHVVMHGNCYAKIERRSNSGEAIGLHTLLPEQVTPDREKSGRRRLIYVVKDGNSPDKTYTVERGKPHDILHIAGLGHDGIQGYSVLQMARHSIGAANSVEKYAAKFFATGGRQPGFIKVQKKFTTDQEADKFRDDLQKFVNNPENFHKWPIFEPGMEFQNGGWSPEDSQFLETRQFNPAEICRWFLISPHLVGDLSRATFSNIEHLALQFVKMTLTAWIVRWEQNLWRCVLTPEEKTQGYYFKHNVNGLLRGDFQSRMAGYATLLQNGIASVNQVRELEDWNPIDGGDSHHVQLNMATLPGTGEPLPGQLVKIGNGSARGGAPNGQ